MSRGDAPRVGTRAFLLGGILVALLIAGVGSYYASSHPDGLEYVAESSGFLDTAEDSPTAGSPLADYGTAGVDNERVSVAIPGVVGTLLVLLVAGGIGFAVRRREGAEPAPGERSDAAAAGRG
ncbi:PDGLE domain-containing protein [Nocardioides sp.]|uniref:PDGLE domain-containing protein n=1 Tax=Nocardioides sp. TaxID=35761 RepID=UPI003514BFD5